MTLSRKLHTFIPGFTYRGHFLKKSPKGEWWIGRHKFVTLEAAKAWVNYVQD